MGVMVQSVDPERRGKILRPGLTGVKLVKIGKMNEMDGGGR